MFKTIVQIYEVQRQSEAEKLVSLGVDHVGSVLMEGGKWKQPALRRCVESVQAGGAKSSLIPLTKDQVKIFSALDYYRPDIVHLCDNITLCSGGWGEVREFDALLTLQIDLKDRFPQIDIMRSLPVPPPGTPDASATAQGLLQLAGLFAPVSDYFLIDTLSDGEDQPVAGYVGITGEVCDWEIAADLIMSSPIPVIMAGGISSANVYGAITRLRPAGIDSCTKTNARDREGNPIRFKKDMKKVRALLGEVRRADGFLNEGGK